MLNYKIVVFHSLWVRSIWVSQSRSLGEFWGSSRTRPVYCLKTPAIQTTELLKMWHEGMRQKKLKNKWADASSEAEVIIPMFVEVTDTSIYNKAVKTMQSHTSHIDPHMMLFGACSYLLLLQCKCCWRETTELGKLWTRNT